MEIERVHSVATKAAIEKAAKDVHLLNITMVKQPPQSPEFNALDAGIFHSLQKNVWKEKCKNIDDLIAAVETVYENLSRVTLDNVWLSVQCAMEDCLHEDGDNAAPIRHMSKAMLHRQGILPALIKCKPKLIARGNRLLASAGVLATVPEEESSEDEDSCHDEDSSYYDSDNLDESTDESTDDDEDA